MFEDSSWIVRRCSSIFLDVASIFFDFRGCCGDDASDDGEEGDNGR